MKPTATPRKRRLRVPRVRLKPLRHTLAAVLILAIAAIGMACGWLSWCLGDFACQDWLVAAFR